MNFNRLSIRALFGLSIFLAAARVFAASPGDIVINEIMYDPSGTDSGREWVEIFNRSASPVDLTGWRFFDGSNHTFSFPNGGSIIPCGGFAIIADNSTTFLTEYATHPAVSGGIVIESVVGLTNAGDTAALLDNSLVVISSLTYGAGWPAAAGQSIERIDHAGSDNNPSNWALGTASGTPNVRNLAATGAAVTCAAPEACGNGTDDDSDGLADCADSDCANTAGCLAPGTSTSTAKVVEVDDATNPFSPFDYDSSRRTGRILFNAHSASVLKTLRIVNVRGETVRLLINTDTGPSGTSFAGVAAGTVLWDGRDDQGELVPIGIYVIFLEGVNPDTGDRVTGRDTIAVGRPF